MRPVPSVKSKLFLNVLVLGTAAFVSTVADAAVADAARGRISRCEGLFETKRQVAVTGKASSDNRTLPLAKTGALAKVSSSRELVGEAVPMHLKERVVLVRALEVHNHPNFISVEHSNGIDVRPRTDDGEYVAVSFLVGQPNPPATAGAIGYSGYGRDQVGYDGRSSAVAVGSKNRNALAAARPNSVTVAEITALGLNPAEIVTNYVRNAYPGERITDDVIQDVVIRIQDNPKLMAEALALHQSRTLRTEGHRQDNRLAINLSNSGRFRYFRFTPDGQKNEMIARILDIDRSGRPVRGFHLLVEWMNPESDPESGFRVRNIQSLSTAELQTMRPMPESVRRLIEVEFQNSLTPFELQTQRLAAILKLKTFGYTNMERGDDGNRSLNNPLADMSNVIHVKANKDVERRFGSLAEFLTPEETASPNGWRVFDVMGRLNPRFVLSRFESRATNFLYLFVITEDGQLKISPFAEGSVNANSDILRLAHGRRVFVGGTFTIAADGRLNIVLDSHRYQDVRSEGDIEKRPQAYRTEGQEGLDSFVSFAFGLQTGRAVLGIGSEYANAFYTTSGQGDRGQGRDNLGGDRYGHESFFRFFGGDSRDGDPRGDAGFGSREAYDFVFKTFKSGSHSRGRAEREKARKLEWKNADAPLEFEKWLKVVGLGRQNEQANRFDWSHYVLRSNPDMSVDQLKLAYRRAAAILHPDRRKDQPEPILRAQYQLVEEANTFLIELSDADKRELEK